jgi:hypothetical protein
MTFKSGFAFDVSKHFSVAASYDSVISHLSDVEFQSHMTKTRSSRTYSHATDRIGRIGLNV